MSVTQQTDLHALEESAVARRSQRIDLQCINRLSQWTYRLAWLVDWPFFVVVDIGKFSNPNKMLGWFERFQLGPTEAHYFSLLQVQLTTSWRVLQIFVGPFPFSALEKESEDVLRQVRQTKRWMNHGINASSKGQDWGIISVWRYQRQQCWPRQWLCLVRLLLFPHAHHTFCSHIF